jgi:hypothetical protein
MLPRRRCSTAGRSACEAAERKRVWKAAMASACSPLAFGFRRGRSTLPRLVGSRRAAFRPPFLPRSKTRHIALLLPKPLLREHAENHIVTGSVSTNVLTMGGKGGNSRRRGCISCDLLSRTEDAVECPDPRHGGGLRGDLVPTVRATIGFLKPFLQAVVTEDVLALRQTQGRLDDTLWTRLAKVVVADDAC